MIEPRHQSRAMSPGTFTTVTPIYVTLRSAWIRLRGGIMDQLKSLGAVAILATELAACRL
jgi:hypothetical protein